MHTCRRCACPGPSTDGRPDGLPRRDRAWPRDFSFLPKPSKGFNLFPRGLPKASIPFQKLQKISANLDLSMGYRRTWPKRTSRRAARPAPAWAARLNVGRPPRRLSSSMPSSLAGPARGELFDENQHSIECQVPKAFVARRQKRAGERAAEPSDRATRRPQGCPSPTGYGVKPREMTSEGAVLSCPRVSEFEARGVLSSSTL